MGLSCALFAIAAGCRSPSTAAPSPGESSVLRAGQPANASPATKPTTADAKPGKLDDVQIDADVRTMIGGMFAPDHIGPEDYAAVLARVDAAPERYARRLGILIESEIDVERLPDLYIVGLLARLHARAPAQVMLAASILRDRHDRLLAGPIDERRKSRLLENQVFLKTLGGRIDPPWDPSWKRKEPESLCTTPTPDGQGLTVEIGCTCGEVPVCRAELDGNRLHVQVRLDETQPMRCYDCYPGHSTCTLPKLAPSQKVKVDIDGRALGTIVAQDSGWIAPGVCMSRR